MFPLSKIKFINVIRKNITAYRKVCYLFSNLYQCLGHMQ
jgi:hypothetical protein